MKKLIKPAIFIAVIIVILLLNHFTDFSSYLTFDNLVLHKDGLVALVAENLILSVVIYVAIYALVVALSIPGATMLTLSGGLLYGTLFGTIFVNIGASVGALAAFFVSRYFLGVSFQEKYAEKLEKFNSELDKNGVSYLLTLRLIPIFPFFLINLLAGLTNIKAKTFFWTTSLGIIPGSIVFVFAGSQLETIKNPKDILSLNMVGALVLLGLFSLVPVLVKRIKKGRTV